MKVIISHINADFDAVAGMVAARKIFPGAVLCLPGGLDRSVREFMTMYMPHIEFTPVRVLDFEKISTLIIVDTRSPQRIGPFRKILGKKGLEIILCDHHPRKEDDIQGVRQIDGCTGAVTTLFVNHLRLKKKSMTSLEATLFALGVYEDTGSFLHAGTTPLDLKIAGYLLSNGADLSIVSRYVRSELGQEQRYILQELSNCKTEITVKGVTYHLAAMEYSRHVSGLDIVVQRLRDIENIPILIVVVKMKINTYVIGRNSTEWIDLLAVFEKLGGGGHAYAGSAVLKNEPLDATVDRIKELMSMAIKPQPVARDIMSRPVKLIRQETTVKEASRLLLRYGHSALLVTDGQELVGTVSRIEIERAFHHGLGHAPVKGFMSRQIVKVSEDATVSEMQRLMLIKHVSRLPVYNSEGRLQGIVTRTDILRALYKDYPANREHHVTFNPQTAPGRITEELKEHFPERAKAILEMAGKLAFEIGMAVYLVGGVVRDIFLGVKNFDIDLVVEGDGLVFAEALAEKLDAELVRHVQFKTAKLRMKDGLKVDIATARREFYDHPGALPEVEKGNLRDDLYRRDFTINTLAVNLMPGAFGELIDLFGGWGDIVARKIRVLHSLSFVEDPTRIFRAIRFEQRFAMSIDRETEGFMREALEHDMISKLEPTRVRNELILMLSEEYPSRVVARLEEYKLLSMIVPSIKITSRKLKALDRIAVEAAASGIENNSYSSWIVALGMLLVSASREDRENALHYLKLSNRQIRETLLCCTAIEETAPELVKRAKRGEISNSVIYENLKPLSQGALIAMLAYHDEELLRIIVKNYLSRLKDIKLELGGDYLRQKGLPSSNAYSRILGEALRLKLDRKICSLEDEKRFLDLEVEKALAGKLN